MSNFKDLKEVALGEAGEQIVYKWLLATGRALTIETDVGKKPSGGHTIDAYCTSANGNYFLEVKTKTIMGTEKEWNATPHTGMDDNDFDTYILVKEKSKLPVYIAFVDPIIGAVYGEEVDRLISPSITGFTTGNSNLHKLDLWAINRFHMWFKLSDLEKSLLIGKYYDCNGSKYIPTAEKVMLCEKLLGGF